jgi:hypothetical protein
MNFITTKRGNSPLWVLAYASQVGWLGLEGRSITPVSSSADSVTPHTILTEELLPLHDAGLLLSISGASAE